MELPGLAWTLLMQQQGQAAMARGRPPAAVLPSGMPIGTMVDPAVVMAFSDPTRAGAFQRGAFLPTFGRSLAQDLPGVILQTAMGGGSLSRSLGILGGQSLASSLMGNLGKEVGGKVVGGMLGQVMSGIIPGGGGLIGMGIGKLFGSIFGKGEQIEVNRTREQFVQAMGGLDALNKRAHEVGLTLDGFLRADSMEEYRREVDKLTEAFRKQEEQIQRNVT